jgi:tRNA(Ile)-lysidine synthetase-like protein
LGVGILRHALEVKRLVRKSAVALRPLVLPLGLGRAPPGRARVAFFAPTVDGKGMRTFPKRPYPQPGEQGGRIIRALIESLRSRLSGINGSHILIAVSAGSDSVALAHLLARYGRRVAPLSKIRLLHVNHGWRGAASDADARFVRGLGSQLGVPVTIIRLKGSAAAASFGQSWEEQARLARKRIFEEQARKHRALVLTAHTADDLAETVLWRIFTGGAETHGGGILPRDGVEVRPLLSVRKEELRSYLREEAQSWREDATNWEGRFLRSRMRLELMPAIERIFPRAVSHLCRAAMSAQARESAALEGRASAPSGARAASMLEASGLRLKRSHWKEIERVSREALSERREIQLPEGWKLVSDPPGPKGRGAGKA